MAQTGQHISPTCHISTTTTTTEKRAVISKKIDIDYFKTSLLL